MFNLLNGTPDAQITIQLQDADTMEVFETVDYPES
jgi:hypothetical protein